jgi:hypothetical protein
LLVKVKGDGIIAHEPQAIATPKKGAEAELTGVNIKIITRGEREGVV